MSGIIGDYQLKTGVIGQGSTGPSFAVMPSANLSLSADTHTKMVFNTIIFDSHGCFDNSTNYRFSPNVPGYYQYTCMMQFSSLTAGDSIMCTVRRDGNSSLYNNAQGRANGTSDTVVSTLCTYFDGSSADYIEVWAYSNDTNTVSGQGGVSTAGSILWATKIG